MKYVVFVLALILAITPVMAYDGPVFKFTNVGGGIAPWTWNQGYSTFTYSQNGLNKYGGLNSGNYVQYSKTPFDSRTYGSVDGTTFNMQSSRPVSVSTAYTSKGYPYQQVTTGSSQVNQFSVSRSGSYGFGVQRIPGTNRYAGSYDRGTHAGLSPFKTRVYPYPGVRSPTYARTTGYAPTGGSLYRGGSGYYYSSAYVR